MGTEATIEIACDARFCWGLLADPRLVPEWIAGVADAEILEIDDEGRAVRVRFGGMPSTGSIGYGVTYRYDEPGLVLRWESFESPERRIDGEARLVELGAGRCRLHYALTTWTSRSLPAWAKDTLAGDTPERAVHAFQRFAERRAATIIT
jgi:hypothetical protein